MPKKIIFALSLFLLLIGLQCFPAPETALADGVRRWSDYATVKIEGGQFKPRTIRVSSGTTVRWVNFDEEEQNVTSGADTPDGRFGSGVLGQDGFYEVTLNKKGEYPFYSAAVPSMRGTVVVE
ncbi:MAG: cupredoxin domain-containing protein [Thermodesulfobacteriota bacterium]